MGSPPRDPYHNRSMEPRLSRDPPRESFNLMVVGEAGLGKTTLLESFFKSFKVTRSASLPFARALCAHGRRAGPLARTARPPRHRCRLDRTRRRASHRSRRFFALVSYPHALPSTHSPPYPPPTCSPPRPGRRRDLRPLRAEGDTQRHRDAPSDRGGLCAAHCVRARHPRVSLTPPTHTTLTASLTPTRIITPSSLTASPVPTPTPVP